MVCALVTGVGLAVGNLQFEADLDHFSFPFFHKGNVDAEVGFPSGAQAE